ncbi:MAG TPA: hypothetical protein VHE13_16730 [Opitutus sp.]|nr:hypothetical protein [Opitutus sp.]
MTNERDFHALLPANGSSAPSAAPAHRSPMHAGFREMMPVLRLLAAQVRARWLLGAVTALAVMGGLGWWLFHGPPDYTAETTLMVAGERDEPADLQSNANFNLQRRENLLEGHLSAMRTRAFRLQLMRSLTPKEAARVVAPYLEPGETAGDDPDLLEDVLRSGLSVDRERGGELFTVLVQHRNPAVAMMLADRFASVYQNVVRIEQAAAESEAGTVLRARAQQLGGEIEELEKRRRAYRQSHQLISVDEDGGLLAARQKRLNETLSAVRVQSSQLEAQIAQATADLAKTPRPFQNETLASFGSTPQLRTEIGQLEAERDSLAQNFGPQHPRMIEIGERLDALRGLVDDNFKLALANLRGQLQLTAASEQRLKAEMSDAFDQALALEVAAIPFKQMGEELDAKRHAQALVLGRLEDMKVAADLEAGAIRVVDPAFLPPVGVGRLVGEIVLIAVAGLTAFLAAPLLSFLFNQRISGCFDLEVVLGRELLGAIPRLTQVAASRRGLIVQENRRPTLTEVFVSVIGQLELVSTQRPPKVLLVTSTVPGEGKSTIASNLAASYTRLGRRTVLVDFDWRRPAQHRIHGVPLEGGLVEWAATGFRLTPELFLPGSPLGLRVLEDGTSLIPSGGMESQPARLLASPAIAALFARMRAEFEIVIVDSPPAGIFHDALVVAGHCDETLLVAREGRAHTLQVRRLVQELGKTPAPAVGVVLNAFAAGFAHPHFAHRHRADKYGYKYNVPASVTNGAARGATAPASPSLERGRS